MYEFDSVSVSSFEAASLAVTLTEKSADGWDVVAVVPAGSDVVAYLRRSTAAASTPAVDEPVVESTPEVPAEPAAAKNETPAIDLLTTTTSSTSETPVAAATASTADSGTGASAGWGASSDPAAESTSWGGGSSGGGWSGGAQESSGPSGAQESSGPSGAQESSGLGGAQESSGLGGAQESASWGGSAQQQPAAATPSTPSVPAGWYADPAGRFELRYWDGNAWTEHVSRAGQQYTDPPVA